MDLGMELTSQSYIKVLLNTQLNDTGTGTVDFKMIIGKNAAV